MVLAEFLIELKLNEEQDKSVQIVTGSSGTAKYSMYDEYINASKGLPAKGRGKQGDGKGSKSNWRAACDCSQGHHCPKYHPRRQPGRCAICGSTRHYTSQCTRPVKPKAKSAEWDETTWQQEEAEWQDPTWEIDEYEASKVKKGKGKGSKPKEKSKGKSAQRPITPRPAQSQSSGDRSQPKPKPEARSCMTSDFLFAMMSTKSKPAWRYSTCNGMDYMICTVAERQKKLSVFKPGHDVKNMKQFTLHFDVTEQCDSLDRLWFGEMWFPVEKYVCQVQSSVTYVNSRPS